MWLCSRVWSMNSAAQGNYLIYAYLLSRWLSKVTRLQIPLSSHLIRHYTVIVLISAAIVVVVVSCDNQQYINLHQQTIIERSFSDWLLKLWIAFFCSPPKETAVACASFFFIRKQITSCDIYWNKQNCVGEQWLRDIHHHSPLFRRTIVHH